MPSVATLISHPKTRALNAALVDRVSLGVDATGIDWLADAVACDIFLSPSADPVDTENLIRQTLDHAPVDIVVQRADTRRKAVLLADMDSTMIDQECIDELADEVGLKERVAAITARAMNGEIAFEPALRERVALLKGIALDVVDRIVETRLTLASGGRELVATMRSHGGYAALISGGFTVFTSKIAPRLGFDEHRANRLVVEDGRFGGLVEEPILGRQAKADALTDIAHRRGLSPFDVIAVGDGANDLDMLRLAGSGVAVHAKPVVAAAAPMRIDHGDLTALLYIQGYRRSEFVA